MKIESIQGTCAFPPTWLTYRYGFGSTAGTTEDPTSSARVARDFTGKTPTSQVNFACEVANGRDVHSTTARTMRSGPSCIAYRLTCSSAPHEPPGSASPPVRHVHHPPTAAARAGQDEHSEGQASAHADPNAGVTLVRAGPHDLAGRPVAGRVGQLVGVGEHVGRRAGVQVVRRVHHADLQGRPTAGRHR